MPVNALTSATSTLKYITPISPIAESVSPAQKHLLLTSALSSAKNISEKPAIQMMLVLVSRTMNAGPM